MPFACATGLGLAVDATLPKSDPLPSQFGATSVARPTTPPITGSVATANEAVIGRAVLWDDCHLMTRPRPGENPGRIAVELAGHAHLWGGAVSIEVDRVRSAKGAYERHVDGYFLVFAIRQVVRSAEAMQRAVGGDAALKEAQDRFLAEHPQAQAMRDVLSHFDDYERGTGRLQKSGEVGDIQIWFGVGDPSFTLALASGLTIELSAASTAAIALANATLEAEVRFLERLRAARETWPSQMPPIAGYSHD